MVEMICGAYGAKGRLIRPADGPFSLSAEEEKRLVDRGVARYVREYVEPDEPGGSQEDNTETPQPEQEKPPRPKKSGKSKPEEDTPPALAPEGPVI